MTKITHPYLFLIFFLFACEQKPSMDTSIDPPNNPDNLCEIINHNNESGEELDEVQEEIALGAVYDKFELYVREKNTDGLKSIFLHDSISLFITGKETSGIKSISLNGPEFENYIANNHSTHELRISNTDFSIFNGSAVSWANYEEVILSNVIATGIDLFFYIKTEEGWKLATTNNTYILTGDNTDYEATSAMAESPNVTLDKMIKGFNEKDKNDFLAAFKNNASFIVLSSSLTEKFSSSEHTVEAFINCILSDDNVYSLSLINETVEIKDQYLAEVIADYQISLAEQEIGFGKMVITMIGTPAEGWKISAAALTY